MEFHLVYSGPLRASGNKPKPQDVARIREALHPQLEVLWRTHNALKVLLEEGAKKLSGPNVIIASSLPPRQLAQKGPTYEDCIPPIEVGARSYLPLVRESLHLSCELDIVFLRQQDPGALISQGGDIDGRIKLLLDALRMPSKQEQEVAPPDTEGLIFCLMQEDHLVSRLNVDTDRLLFPKTDKADEAHLIIKVSLNVLKVAPYNICLL